MDGQTFLRYPEIVSQERAHGKLVLHAGRPQPVVLSIEPQDWLMTEELVERGRAGRSETGDPELEARLLVGPRQADGYRVTALDRDRLLRLAVDAHADPSARVAAGDQLQSAGSDEERATLKASLAETAHPRVRQALQAVLEGAQARLRVPADFGIAEETEPDEGTPGRTMGC